jgi:hypothetical protein
MRRRTFLYAVAASGGIGKARLAKAQTQAMTSPEFPFHVSVETRNDRLLIHYEVENLSSRDVYLYTREVVRNDEIVDAPGVEFDGDRENKTLWVYKVPNVIVGALLSADPSALHPRSRRQTLRGHGGGVAAGSRVSTWRGCAGSLP